MYCSGCGTKLFDNPKFCSSCGKSTSGSVKAKAINDTDKSEASLSTSFLTVIFIFIPVFLVVMVVNQFFYGGCFKSYCLAAAFPKVTIISAVLALIFYASSKD
ncbi:MAG: hypothetical protein NWQ54_00470 [Paraglaciecola sp.]|uniref:hypothetical protein n=1 Tax=Paraglaciecola sp. TaxID=1920173 RepID=UPI00274000DC|nr:hypothetical protein [Paraglaciecola sp.]MDP5029612.1 hypothetical protein [Paraglaciecola sp.]MDP5129323.1 hypothetical protein [Paraglaciecola sp.]